MTIQNILQELRGVWLCVSCVCMLGGGVRELGGLSQEWITKDFECHAKVFEERDTGL